MIRAGDPPNGTRFSHACAPCTAGWLSTAADRPKCPRCGMPCIRCVNGHEGLR